MTEDQRKYWAYVAFKASAFPQLSVKQQMANAAGTAVTEYKPKSESYQVPMFPIRGVTWSVAKRIAQIDIGISYGALITHMSALPMNPPSSS